MEDATGKGHADIPAMYLGLKYSGYIVRVHSPFFMWVRPKKWEAAFSRMEKFLCKKYFIERRGKVVDKYVQHEMCVVDCPENGTLRGITLEWTGDGSKVLVDMIDVCETRYFESEAVYYLEEDVLKQMDILLSQCCLIGCVPAFDNGWDEEDMAELEDFLCNQFCTVKIVEKMTKGGHYVTMTFGEENRDLTRYIIDRGMGNIPARSMHRDVVRPGQ